jgi:hypothetical protein
MMIQFPMLVFIAPAIGLGMAVVLLRSDRRALATVECPSDHRAHEVMLRGSTLDGSLWTRVTECGLPGEPRLKGNALRCDRACLSLGGLPEMPA